MSSADFHDLMLSNPTYFLEAKKIVNQQRAERLAPLNPLALCTFPLFPKGFRNTEWGQRIAGLMRPRVYDASSKVTEAHSPITELFYCLHGVLGDGVHKYSAGSFVGVQEFLANKSSWPHTLRASSRLDMWVLDVDTFKKLLRSSQKFRAAFCKLHGFEPM